MAALTERLIEVFSDHRSRQIVLVNDGSQDGTHEVCVALVENLSPFVSYLCLAKNFGEHNAAMAGLRHARGDYVVATHDDGQHRPEDALRLVDEARTKGLDIVYSSYPTSEHHWFRILASRFNGMIANCILDNPRICTYQASSVCGGGWSRRSSNIMAHSHI